MLPVLRSYLLRISTRPTYAGSRAISFPVQPIAGCESEAIPKMDTINFAPGREEQSDARGQ